MEGEVNSPCSKRGVALSTTGPLVWREFNPGSGSPQFGVIVQSAKGGLCQIGMGATGPGPLIACGQGGREALGRPDNPTVVWVAKSPDWENWFLAWDNILGIVYGVGGVRFIS